MEDSDSVVVLLSVAVLAVLAVLASELVGMLTNVVDTSSVGVAVSTLKLAVSLTGVGSEVNVALLSTENGVPHDEVDACGAETLGRVVTATDSDGTTVDCSPNGDVDGRAGIKGEGSTASVEVATAGASDTSTVKGSPQLLVCAEEMPMSERSSAFWSDDFILLLVGVLCFERN